MERKSLTAPLQHIAAEQGSDILTDEKRLLAIFSDYYPQETSQKNELRRLCEYHVLSEIGKVDDDPRSVSIAVQKMVHILMDQGFISEERARLMVNDIAQVLKPNSAPAPQTVSTSQTASTPGSNTAPNPAPREDPPVTFPNTLQAGDSITFGRYPQSGSNPEPIEWQVLTKEGNRALITSKYALDCKRYHQPGGDTTWESCTLRQWLNESFLRAAFTAGEQKKILTVTVPAHKNPKSDMDPGSTTRDKVFLLSIPEVETYFSSDGARKCAPTAHATSTGGYINNKYTVGGKPTCSWWLRSPGSSQYFATAVYNDGSILARGNHVDYGNTAVRPALWIELDSVSTSAPDPWSAVEQELDDMIRLLEKAERAALEAEQARQNCKVGDIIPFGRYPQKGKNPEPISWRVLARNGSRALVISEYALDANVASHYHTKQKITWETSPQRNWLNSTFFTSAFTAEEQRSIQQTLVSADRNPRFNTKAGESTTDKIFLLSIPEIEKYLPSEESRKCFATRHAVIQGARTDSVSSNGSCYWWTRTPGEYKSSFTYVRSDGSIDMSGIVESGYYSSIGPSIRPVMWIDVR